MTALVGDNGAGKSTLVKAIAGIHPIDTGTYLFDGEPVTVHGPNDAAGLGVEVVYQDLALCDNLDIVSNMFLGREVIRRGTLDEAAMETMARDALASLSVRTVKSVRQPVSSLSGGQRQTVAIAKSVLWKSKVVLLDEPTAALGVAQTRQVLDLVRRLADQGVGVVLISHNLADVFEVADRICALYLGRVAAEVKTPRSPTARWSNSSPPAGPATSAWRRPKPPSRCEGTPDDHAEPPTRRRGFRRGPALGGDLRRRRAQVPPAGARRRHGLAARGAGPDRAVRGLRRRQRAVSLRAQSRQPRHPGRLHLRARHGAGIRAASR